MRMPSYDDSQNRYMRLFERYVDVPTQTFLDDNFRTDILRLREVGEDMTNFEAIINGEASTSPFAEFMIRYDLPFAMVDFLYHYIINDTIDPSLIRSGMFIVSEADRTAVGRDNSGHLDYFIYKQISTHGGRELPKDELKLVIPNGVTLNQAKDFLDNNWVSFVSQKQSLYSVLGDATTSAIRPRNYRGTAELYRRIMDLADSGKSHREIANIVNTEFNRSASNIISAEYISTIIRRERQRNSRS